MSDKNKGLEMKNKRTFIQIREEIKNLLKQYGELSTYSICKALKLHRNTALKHLKAMVEANIIEKTTFDYGGTKVAYWRIRENDYLQDQNSGQNEERSHRQTAENA